MRFIKIKGKLARVICGGVVNEELGFMRSVLIIIIPKALMSGAQKSQLIDVGLSLNGSLSSVS